MKSNYRWIKKQFWHLVFPYLIFWFCFAEPNPFSWTLGERVFFVVVSIGWNLILTLYSDLGNN
jgi:hypothetical protein